MAVLAFVPARGGSKGIPGKNLHPLAGKPLIQYTIEAARQSESVDEIFVSSDDLAIIAFCQSLGVDVPYVRPAELARDNSPLLDAVLHALKWRRQTFPDRFEPEGVLVLQPTSPLRQAEDINGAVRLFREQKLQSLVSVHEMTEHPYECVRLAPEGWTFLAKPAAPVSRRQDYVERFYFINGAIYLNSPDFLESRGRFLSPGETGLQIMPRERGVDIDELADLRLAEALLCSCGQSDV